jgi:hypothetical protein
MKETEKSPFHLFLLEERHYRTADGLVHSVNSYSIHDEAGVMQTFATAPLGRGTVHLYLTCGGREYHEMPLDDPSRLSYAPLTCIACMGA